MTDQSVRGRYLWHELMTPDSAAAQTFYAESLGWQTASGEEDSSYSMFMADSRPLGGVADSAGGPTRWIAYIGTPDLDATVNDAQRLGGSVLKAQTAIPGTGRYAILADPQGAAFGVYSSEREPEPDSAPRQGDFVWHELATSSWEAAWNFYSSLFGWDKIAEHDMGPMGIYLIFGRGDTQLGGMFNKGDMGAPGDAYWLGYVSVENVHEAVEKIKSAGGTVAVGPMEVPGGSWVAQCVDPQGALFAVHTSAETLQGVKEVPESLETSVETVDRPDDRSSTPTSAATTTPKKATPKKAARKKAARKKAGNRQAAAARPAAERRVESIEPEFDEKPAGEDEAAGVVSARSSTVAGRRKKAKKKAAKRAGKKTAKKAAKKASKKTAKRAGKKASKKAAGKKTSKRKTGKKTRKVAAKKAGKKTAKAAGKKAGKKSGKKTGKKRSAGTRGGKKKAGAGASAAGAAGGRRGQTSKKAAGKKTARKKAGGKKTAGAKKAGARQTRGKKAGRKKR